MKRLFGLALTTLAIAAPAHTGEDLTLEQLLTAFQMDLATTEVRTEKVGEGLYVLFGAGGNVAASIGPDGVLIVDDQFPEMIPKLNAAIAELGGGPIDYAINTHQQLPVRLHAL